MSQYNRILIFLISLVLLLFIVVFIRRRKLQIKYSVLWLLTGFVLLFLTSWIELADQISGYLGVSHSPSLYFFLAIVFLLLIAIHVSVELSKFSLQLKSLIQEVSLLKHDRSATRMPNEEHPHH
jgi:hypothetical protein